MNTEKTALGIDIGGTKIYAGLVNKNGDPYPACKICYSAQR